MRHDVCVVHVSDASDLARLRAICLAFPSAEEGIRQDRPLFHVRRRRFAIFNGDDSPPRPRWSGFGRSLHFATDPAERDALRQDPRFRVSPHHGDTQGWMALDLDATDVDWSEIAELMETAYRFVAPRALIAELEMEAD
jgi:predicted DNA-binding protein (MmcQ/YjbR family)